MEPGGHGALLDALRGVRWPARRVIAGSVAGEHHSRLRGASPEFSGYRMYRQGDDPRRVDWRLLARSDRAWIRLSTDRAVLRTTIIVDASASMAFPADTLGKWRLATAVAVGLSAVAHAAGDPVALWAGAGAAPVHLPARTRRGVPFEVARALDELVPAGDLELAPLVRRARGSPRMAIVTDFLGDDDDLLRACREQLAAGGEVHAIHVIAHEELHPDHQSVLATDPERPSIRRALTARSRSGYLEAFGAWQAQLANAWRAAGAAYSRVLTTDDPARAVRSIVAGAESSPGS